MPVEAKPLFRPDVLRPRLAGFQLPEAALAGREALTRWADLLGSAKADSLKEQELLPDFLADVFHGVLGYSRAVDDGDRPTFSREKHVQIDGKFADAVLGELAASPPRFAVVVEGKGPKDPLDRPFAGRGMSAVDQAYRYAINLPCDWIVVTSMRQTRLYHKGADQYTYERFDVGALAHDDAQFRRFVFLLGAWRVIPPAPARCHLYDLLADSEKVGRELTRDFYVRYAESREDAFDRLRRANPAVGPHDALAATQKLLDRALFCAFCEDRGLLPPETVARAYGHADPYNPRPVWDNFKGLFRAMDVGNPALNVPAYNGGLFAEDPVLDRMSVPDAVCRYFQDLAEYDYRPPHEAVDEPEPSQGGLVDVDVLGHIFEQSITDLERIKNELDGLPESLDRAGRASRRKREGAFYTPAFITRHIVAEALGKTLADRFEALRLRHSKQAEGTARRALADPAVYDLAALNAPQRAALVRFWEDWQDHELTAVKVLDPSCGSGAFLIEAFEQLYLAYQRSNDRLEELRGERSLFDLDRRILQHNLYGVDLNDEAVQIARLSLWIKTAQRGKVLTSLDHGLRVGNSVVDDPDVHPRAFDWKAAFPEVFEQGGFDVVVGNPPYVRQEWISAYKPYLQRTYKTYHGVADLYVYFYELGARLLRPGGRLSFVVTNKWLKAAYGEPLRGFFARDAWVESVVDFGHAKQIFADADVFPSILVARKPTQGPAPRTVRVCSIPREQLRVDDLSKQIEAEGFDVDRSRLAAEAWSLEPRAVVELMAKIRDVGIPLAEYAGVKPLLGIKTGFNEAFLIDTATRNALIADDPACEEVIRPYLRGQDVKRWTPDWAGLWMIALKSSGDHPWPWADAGERAEDVFRDTYPSLHARMKPLQAALTKRQDKGRNWWELRACAYWGMFDETKIIYQEIQFHPSYTLDSAGRLGNNKTFSIAVDDLYLLCVLNSPLMWWHNWRFLPHMKDEALSPVAFLVETLPVARPTDEIRAETEAAARRLIDIATTRRVTRDDLLDWLKVEHEIESPGVKLQSALDLDSDGLVAEVRKARGRKRPLSLAGLKGLREEHARTVGPAQALAREAAGLERRVGELVNRAYGLTAAEEALMWSTAPPRMPIAGPSAGG